MENSNEGAKDEEATSSLRRPRAPTITIDTTAVNNPPSILSNSEGAQQGRLISYSPVSYTDEGHSPSTTIDPMASSWSSHQRSLSGPRPELHAEKSFESGRDSRPTSPHNVSSPVTSRGNDRSQNFLSVPSALRSRQNSVDSEDGSRSFVSSQGDTMIGSTSYQGDNAAASSISTDNSKIREDGDALKPDHETKADFEVEDNPFAFTPGQLNKMLNPKSLSAFYQMGGLAGLEKGLQTDRKAGLSLDEARLEKYVSFEEATRRTNDCHAEGVPAETAHQSPLQVQTSHTSHGTRRDSGDSPFTTRKRIFKDNRLPEKKGKGLLQLMWVTYNDKVLMLLSAAAVISLGIGLYQTFGQPHNASNPPVEWIEGVAIIVAIVIVVVVGSLNDYQKERQFANLNKKKQDHAVKAVRSGKIIEMSVFDILVGDVLHLQPGDMVPVDGVLIEGFNVKCDESQATGESDIIRKKPADEVFAAIESNQELKKMDPFIQSGAHVMEGVGTFLVTSTGVYSSYGRTLMALEEDPEITPLQSKLNIIAEYIAKVGGAAGLLLFIVLFIEFLVRLPHNTNSPAEKGQEFLNIFIVVVTIIVVAVPEGLPLAVTLALAYATNRMLKDNNLVRHLKACEVMGNATNICSDKTGTLTENKMQVVAGTVGMSHRFGGDSPARPNTSAPPIAEKDISPKELVSMLCPPVQELLRKSISLNSTAFEGQDAGTNTFIGSKTETALLVFARDHLSMGPVSEERANAKILQFIPFDSGRKCMGVVVQLEHGRARLYVKGASEIMLDKCDRVLRDPSTDMSACPLTDENRDGLKNLIESYASHSLRTIGIIYRDFERWPPRGARRVEGERDEFVFEDLCRQMIFVSMVGIKDPLRAGVLEAVRDCQRAGVVVRMVTGDNVLTARAIAKDCGILQPNSVVMEGVEFRNLSKAKQVEIIPNLHILARSSPEDKRVLVKRLKEQGETVAVTGDGTNDAPALKLADVGFSMGISGTEVAKEASAIILMDDNFNSIVKALRWGRAVNDAVKRFLQFQLTVNVTAVLLTFVSAVQSSSETSVLTAVQLLWVNLIMDTLAALALATDPPQASVLDRKPERRGASIISTTMWKMIVGQATYQLVITFLIYFGSPGVLPAKESVSDAQVQTLVFNTFVWMQIFNQWNNRRLDNKFNIFEGLTKNKFFLMINLAMCGAQVLIVIFGGKPFNIAPEGQTPAMWGYAIVLGVLSIPIGVLIRLIPDRLVARLVPEYLKRKAHAKVPGLTVSDEERFSYYPAPLADVRDELTFLKRVKGGRLNNLRFAIKHPRETFMRSREQSRETSIHGVLPQTPSRENSFGSHAGVPTPDSRRRSRSMRSRSNSVLGAATVMSGIVAGSIAVGWSPVERRDSDFGHVPPRTVPATAEGSHGESQPSQPSQPVVGSEEPLAVEPQEQPEAGPSNAAAQGVPILKVPRPPSGERIPPLS